MMIREYNSYEEMMGDVVGNASQAYSKQCFFEVVRHFGITKSNSLNISRDKTIEIINKKREKMFKSIFSPLFSRIGTLFNKEQSEFILDNLTDVQWEFLPGAILTTVTSDLALKAIQNQKKLRTIKFHRTIYQFTDKQGNDVAGIVNEGFLSFLERKKEQIIEKQKDEINESPFTRDYLELFDKETCALSDAVAYLGLSTKTMYVYSHYSKEVLDTKNKNIYVDLANLDKNKNGIISTKDFKELIKNYYIGVCKENEYPFPKEGLYSTSQLVSLYGKGAYVFQYAVRQGNIYYYKFGDKIIRYSLKDADRFLSQLIDNEQARKRAENKKIKTYISENQLQDYLPWLEVLYRFFDAVEMKADGEKIKQNRTIVKYLNKALYKYETIKDSQLFVRKTDVEQIIQNHYGYFNKGVFTKSEPLSLDEFLNSKFYILQDVVEQLMDSGYLKRGIFVYLKTLGDLAQNGKLLCFGVRTGIIKKEEEALNRLILLIKRKTTDKTLTTQQAVKVKALYKEALAAKKQLKTIQNWHMKSQKVEELLQKARQVGIHCKVEYTVKRYYRKEDIINKLKELNLD